MVKVQPKAKAPEKKAVVVTIPASRCPVCQSTQRAGYTGTTVQDFAGIDNGKPYTKIVRRRTICLNCGQARVDRSYEN